MVVKAIINLFHRNCTLEQFEIRGLVMVDYYKKLFVEYITNFYTLLNLNMRIQHQKKKIGRRHLLSPIERIERRDEFIMNFFSGIDCKPYSTTR